MKSATFYPKLQCLIGQIQAQKQNLVVQIRFLIIFGVESTIINLGTNITNIIIRKVINVRQGKCRPNDRALGNSSSYWMLLQRVPIQNHSKSAISEKNIKEGQIPDLKCHKIWACEDNQLDKPCLKLWIYQVLQLE